MSTYPTENRADFVDWCQAHDSVFIDNAPDIGLTERQADDFAEATLKARLKIVAQREAMQAAMAATQEAKAAVAALRAEAGRVVRSIRAYAGQAKNPLLIYNKAQIAPPADKTPAPPPATPNRLSATLDATRGALTIGWKARQPPGLAGTTYLVRRRLPGEAAFTFVGATGAKTFDDAAIPEGATQVEYTVQAVRGKRAGAVSAIFTVRMGAVKRGAVVAVGRALAAQLLPSEKTLSATGSATR